MYIYIYVYIIYTRTLSSLSPFLSLTHTSSKYSRSKTIIKVIGGAVRGYGGTRRKDPE